MLRRHRHHSDNTDQPVAWIACFLAGGALCRACNIHAVWIDIDDYVEDDEFLAILIIIMLTI